MTKFQVPYTAFELKNAPIRKDLVRAFEKVLDSGRYIQGGEVQSFEKAFADFCGVKNAVGVANGTESMSLILRAIGLQPGDEVITAPNSFIASASATALIGGRPVFVDVREDFNIDPALIEEAITPRTRAIMPVHLTGRVSQMPAIVGIAKKHDLFVLEDAAQSVGARLGGRRAGSWGDAASFSLHPLKNLHAYGDAGIVTTDDDAIAARLSFARNHGLRDRDTCEFWSPNSRLDELQAALLMVQMTRIEEWTEERRGLAFRYNALLSPYVRVPDEGPDEYHVYQTYVVVAERREELLQFLRQNGVEALVHYPTPIHMQPAAKNLGYAADDFPVTMNLSKKILSLPLYPGLTHGQQDRVAELFTKFYE